MGTSNKKQGQVTEAVVSVSKRLQEALKIGEIAQIGEYIEVSKDGFDTVIKTIDGYTVVCSQVKLHNTDGSITHFIGNSLKLPDSKVNRHKF